MVNREARRTIPMDVGAIKRFGTDLAKQAIESIERRASYSPDEPIGKGTFAKNYLTIKNVQGKSREVPVQIQSKPGQQLVHSGVYMKSEDQFWEEIGEVTIWLASQAPASMFLEKRHEVADRVASILIHEVTHAMDYFDNLKVEDVEDTDNYGAYVNQPHEIRAFARQIVDQVEKAFRILRLTNRKNMPQGHKLIEQMLEKSPQWKRLEPHLTRKNQQLIMQIVVRELRDTFPEHSLVASVVHRYRQSGNP